MEARDPAEEEEIEEEEYTRQEEIKAAVAEKRRKATADAENKCAKSSSHRSVNFPCREREGLDEIAESGWSAISEERLSLPRNVYGAAVGNAVARKLYSKLEFVELVFGGWLKANVLPYVNKALTKKRPDISQHQRKHYLDVNAEELVGFFLSLCIKALCKHVKHNLDTTELKAMQHALCKKKRVDAIRSCIGFGDHVLEKILASWPAHLCSFLEPGSVSILDETVFSLYGKRAFDEGKLQKIEGKPWDYGLVAYILCQRTHHTKLPICVALRAAFLTKALTPKEYAVHLLRDFHDGSQGRSDPQILVADSLWSQPAVIEEFLGHSLQFLVAIKGVNPLLPSTLVDTAGSDLPLKCSRTYMKGEFCVQVTSEEDRNSTVFSNMWRLPDLDEHQPATKGSYKTAKSLFSKETEASLVSMFRLGPEWLRQSKEKIIYEVTGWDVLRAEDAQGTTEALSYAAASKMSRAQLVAVHAAHFRLRRPSKKTMPKLLVELFPEEARAHDEAAAAADNHRRRKRHREQLQELHSYREQVRDFYIDRVHYLIVSCNRRSVGTQQLSASSISCLIATTMPWIA